MSTKKTKSRTMTAREKKERAAIRKELRAEGLLPPPKKPLNRKKFCEEAEQILREADYGFTLQLVWALLEMLHHSQYPAGTRTLEAVGAAKAIKMAKAREELERKNQDLGKDTYATGELIEAVKDIYTA